MRSIIIITTAILVFGLAISTHAVLIDRGGGMIYSTDLNITWLKDANYAKTSKYDADGLMRWDEAMNWAANLSYAGYDKWRLPTFDPNNPSQCDTSKLHEMRYLLYTELGNNCHGATTNYGPFVNVITDENHMGGQWSGSEVDPNNAWDFYFGCG